MDDVRNCEAMDPMELRREKLQKRQQLILFLSIPSALWQAIRYSGHPLSEDLPLTFDGAVGTVVEVLVGTLTLVWVLALLYNTMQIGKLPEVEPDEREVGETVQRVADGALSTAVLMAVAAVVSVFLPFSATGMGFLYFAISMFSLRFPVARLGNRV